MENKNGIILIKNKVLHIYIRTHISFIHQISLPQHLNASITCFFFDLFFLLQRRTFRFLKQNLKRYVSSIAHKSTLLMKFKTVFSGDVRHEAESGVDSQSFSLTDVCGVDESFLSA